MIDTLNPKPVLPDPYQFALIDHQSIGHPLGHVRTLDLFQESVVKPSLAALDARIAELQTSDDDDVAVFILDDYESLFQSTVEGYLLTVQSMWERSLRNLLSSRARAVSSAIAVDTVQRATWLAGRSPDLHKCFETLIGLPLQAFDSYSDLALLQTLGNALRHGNGPSAEHLHDVCPSLWFNWLPPGTVVSVAQIRLEIPPDAPRHPSFDQITLPHTLLEQMVLSSKWFWEDIEQIRCASFRHKHFTTERAMELRHGNRKQRSAQRVWMLPAANRA